MARGRDGDDYYGVLVQDRDPSGQDCARRAISRSAEARYHLWIDFGEAGTKQSSAQLTALYSSEELVGRLVLAVTNFPARRVAGTLPEVLVLGLPTGLEGEVTLIRPDRDALGSRVF